MSNKDEKETKKKPTPEEKTHSSPSSGTKEQKKEAKPESQTPASEPSEKEKVEQFQKEISRLKQEKEDLRYELAGMKNQQKKLQEQMIETYKYGNERVIK